jgi:hypothetical protein
MDKVQKHNSFNTNTPSSESYKNYYFYIYTLQFKPEIRVFSVLTDFGLNCKHTRVYPKVSGYNSLPLGAVVSLLCESV